MVILYQQIQIIMTHTYNITGMTCTGCLSKVQSLLQQVPNVEKVDISLAKGTADITMKKHVPTVHLQQALSAYPKYQLSEAPAHLHSMTMVNDIENRTWLQTYKPILLIFGYILAAAIIAGCYTGGFNVHTAMRIFMSGFFLIFSFFKLLDIGGFADSYAMYDVVAKRWHGWGYVYVFVELALGLAFALNLAPFTVNIAMVAVMTISLIGVLQSVFNKRQIRCACLGAVFNLPMSTVTIIEDGLMILMGVVTLGIM
jgi:copper chaperone CopZ